MIVIGITGPTGAGKTTVLNVLRELGGAVADCDGVYHELLSTSVPMREELAARFGPGIFDENGDLRRKELGAIVFGDPDALADLNAITHRHIVSELERRIAQAEGEGRPAIALDAVALLESGAGTLCGTTIAVTAPEELRVRRIMAREGIGEDYARARVKAQKPSAWFEERCAHTLRNDGEKASLEEQARELFKSILCKEDL
ncbi:MAG: dephospho-CoA kinase [Oscillospiraceae bacterium]|jgi:dephospho-CoA kinase|nr:dephospho-CoA kinase [Oscillospiraceae bacterium]